MSVVKKGRELWVSPELGTNGVACAQCHHDYNEETINVWAKGDPVRKCAECHSPLNEDEILLNRLKTAYHKQCCQCHMEINKQGGSAPFENCEECHGKKP